AMWAGPFVPRKSAISAATVPGLGGLVRIALAFPRQASCGYCGREDRTATAVSSHQARPQLVKVGRGARPKGVSSKALPKCPQVGLGSRQDDSYLNDAGLIESSVGSKIAIEISVLCIPLDV